MKINALQQLRAKLASDEPVYGLWVTLESASITEMAVAQFETQLGAILVLQAPD